MTGAGSGLGRATAELCASTGARVALADIDQDAVDGVAAELAARGATCTGLRMDVTDLGSVEAAVARAREALFTGRSYRGEALRTLGLVDRLVPRSELEATGYGLAEEIAGNAPLALRGIKRILNLIEASAPLSEKARREAEALFAAALRSEDAKEGQKAFLEKRPPSFVGR